MWLLYLILCLYLILYLYFLNIYNIYVHTPILKDIFVTEYPSLWLWPWHCQQLHLQLIKQEMKIKKKKKLKTIMLIIILWYLKKWLHRHGHVSEQFRNLDFLIECILYTGICNRFLLVVAKKFWKSSAKDTVCSFNQ